VGVCSGSRRGWWWRGACRVGDRKAGGWQHGAESGGVPSPAVGSRSLSEPPGGRAAHDGWMQGTGRSARLEARWCHRGERVGEAAHPGPSGGASGGLWRGGEGGRDDAGVCGLVPVPSRRLAARYGLRGVRVGEASNPGPPAGATMPAVVGPPRPVQAQFWAQWLASGSPAAQAAPRGRQLDPPVCRGRARSLPAGPGRRPSGRGVGGRTPVVEVGGGGSGAGRGVGEEGGVAPGRVGSRLVSPRTLTPPPGGHAGAEGEGGGARGGPIWGGRGVVGRAAGGLREPPAGGGAGTARGAAGPSAITGAVRDSLAPGVAPEQGHGGPTNDPAPMDAAAPVDPAPDADMGETGDVGRPGAAEADPQAGAAGPGAWEVSTQGRWRTSSCTICHEPFADTCLRLRRAGTRNTRLLHVHCAPQSVQVADIVGAGALSAEVLGALRGRLPGEQRPSVSLPVIQEEGGGEDTGDVEMGGGRGWLRGRSRAGWWTCWTRGPAASLRPRA